MCTDQKQTVDAIDHARERLHLRAETLENPVHHLVIERKDVRHHECGVHASLTQRTVVSDSIPYHTGPCTQLEISPITVSQDDAPIVAGATRHDNRSSANALRNFLTRSAALEIVPEFRCCSHSQDSAAMSSPLPPRSERP